VPITRRHRTLRVRGKKPRSATAGKKTTDQFSSNPLWHRLATRVAGSVEHGPAGKSHAAPATLAVSQPRDTHEREADRVAEDVKRKPEREWGQRPAIDYPRTELWARRVVFGSGLTIDKQDKHSSNKIFAPIWYRWTDLQSTK